ncbi:MAG: sulfoxide reductase heme-binding subunit YedZ [Betaproteobacteria bacterium]|jgi:methionine sulfoxide reductase heme-binding subunit|nr:sulfoxide reductase heme-binding subunit YedZ [Betaproteobacteria bacterium]NBZ99246.1 sulfoxide reductase heme-binding subunit YedZ [Betaproteobacteria bacterium]NDB44578.1 sulfoxide reductase heme-binding subunit YedZ [Betaproteobacteria bacterium]NDD02230.1 sulfoxide reductase heme-binding subunit YedZ [Betaproteobacteria bacterium]NDD23336.1 sulfoxide reductase heme-binding subunit YedZ [Betaproteobacteria bacterium]
MLRNRLRQPQAKWVLVLLSLVPFAYLCAGVYFNNLGPNPAEYLIRASGDLTLRFLCITLLITPLRILTQWPEWLLFRRSLGLLTFFYACIHALCYSLLDMSWAWDEIAQDIVKRPFIAVGVAGMLLLTALAATSFNAAVKALGAKRWRQLHRAVYGIAVLAILHFFWMRATKRNFDEVWLYAGILGVLLGFRVFHFTKRSLWKVS